MSKLTKKAVIQNAVQGYTQAFLMKLLKAITMMLKWDGDDLVVTDIMGDEAGRIQPQSSSFIDDFKNDADSLIERLENATAKIVGGR